MRPPARRARPDSSGTSRASDEPGAPASSTTVNASARSWLVRRGLSGPGPESPAHACPPGPSELGSNDPCSLDAMRPEWVLKRSGETSARKSPPGPNRRSGVIASAMGCPRHNARKEKTTPDQMPNASSRSAGDGCFSDDQPAHPRRIRVADFVARRNEHSAATSEQPCLVRTSCSAPRPDDASGQLGYPFLCARVGRTCPVNGRDTPSLLGIWYPSIDRKARKKSKDFRGVFGADQTPSGAAVITEPGGAGRIVRRPRLEAVLAGARRAIRRLP